MNELALFAGAGGGILGGHLLGWRTVCAVERDAYAAQVLAQRQNDGALRPFPIWSDVFSFDGRPWRGIVDVVSGGFPCQDISVAGKGAGIDGARSGMWSHMARNVGEGPPRFVYVENSPALVTRGLGRVLGDLAALGYDCRWTVLGAADVGAPHQRDRFWLVGADTLHGGHGELLQPERVGRGGAAADAGRDGEAWAVADAGCAHGQRRPHQQEPADWQAGERHEAADHAERRGEVVADADRVRQLQPQGRERDQRGRAGDCGAQVRHADSERLEERQGQRGHAREELAAIERADWWLAEPDVGRVADGVAHRVDRLKALGNGQVPACHAAAWHLLAGRGGGMSQQNNP